MVCCAPVFERRLLLIFLACPTGGQYLVSGAGGQYLLAVLAGQAAGLFVNLSEICLKFF